MRDIKSKVYISVVSVDKTLHELKNVFAHGGFQR